MARSQDKFGNLASAEVVESGAGTLTFTELVTGISLGAGKGIIIDQIDYSVAVATRALMTTATDWIAFGWCTSDAVTAATLNINNSRILHFARESRIDMGTAGSGVLVQDPRVYQFFPPLIFASPRIYLYAMGSGLASPGTVRSRIYYRNIDLTDKEYLELAETFVLVG